MNWFQIIGAILSILAAISMFIGTYRQSQKDNIFQENIGNYVTKQNESDVPDLVGLRITGKNPDYKLVVKNIGNKPANKVKLIFKDSSVPDAFAANIISGTSEIPKNTEYELSLNLFSGIKMIMEEPNSEPEYKEKLKEYLDRFNTGETAFIPRFYLEYYMGNRKFISENYHLVIDKNGFIAFDKEVNDQ